jgi:hypothetical protein
MSTRVMLANNLCSAGDDNYMPFGVNTDASGFRHHPFAAWHKLDVAAGIDVGVDAP